MDLSYVWTPVAAMAAELFDLGGEPPGTRTQGPRLKRAIRGNSDRVRWRAIIYAVLLESIGKSI